MDNERIHLLLPESRWLKPGFCWCLEVRQGQTPFALTTDLPHRVTCPRCLKNFSSARSEPGHPLQGYSQLDVLQRAQVFDSPETVAGYCREMVLEPQKHLKCLVLNTQKRLVAQTILIIGTLTRVLYHPREIFQYVLSHNGFGFILVQNQPSGKAEPDAEDCKITKNLVACSKLMQVEFYDHVFVAFDGYYSQREQTSLWL